MQNIRKWLYTCRSMIIFSFCIFIWILTRNSSNIARIMLRFTRSCRTNRISLKTSITRSIDFWIFASIAWSRRSQRSSWSSSFSFRTRFLTKFNQTCIQKLRTSSSSLSKCVLFAKKDITQRTSIANNSISNEIAINSTKNEMIETTNANEITTTTTKDSIQKSMTKKKNTRFTSSSISRFWRLWALCLVTSRIEFWTQFAFNTTYETNRRSFFTRFSRNSFLSTI
jgi:hypothetical protein